MANPTTNPQPSPPTGCNNPSSTPKIAKTVPSANFINQAQNLPIGFGPVNSNGQNIVLWTINGTSMIIDPGKPTIKYIAENNVSSIPQSYNLVQVADSAQV